MGLGTGMRAGGPLPVLLSPGERANGRIGPPGLTASLTLLPGVGTPGSDCVGTPCLMVHVLNVCEVRCYASEFIYKA